MNISENEMYWVWEETGIKVNKLDYSEENALIYFSKIENQLNEFNIALDSNKKFWIDKNTKNKISKSKQNFESALENLIYLSQKNNTNCTDCITCIDCHNCDNCEDCAGCIKCSNCYNCTNGKKLINQSNIDKY